MTKAKPSMRVRAAEHDARMKRAAERRRKALIAITVGAVVVIAMGIAATIWLSSRQSSTTAIMNPLAVDLGCASCHSIDGSRREGPTWQGLSGSEVTLQDGSTVVADADYLRRAIEDPSSEVPLGFNPMPTQQLTPQQVDELVNYIAGL